MKTSIETQIHINAKPESVWAILSNFEKYPDWNPFVKSLTGKVAVGERIRVVLPDMTFRPTVLKFDENTELRWLGKLLIKGVFDGEHYFKLTSNSNGTTTLTHGENFSGILVDLFRKKLETDTKSGFKMMNEALKNRVENA